MPRDDERAPVYKAAAKPAPKTVPAWIRPQGPTNIPQGPVKKKERVFEERTQGPDDRQSLPAPAWNTGFNNNFQNGWSNPQPATNVTIPNPFKNFIPTWNSFWNPPKQNIAISPSFAWTQPKPAVIGGYQPQGSAPFYAAINNQRNQELINIAPNIPQANLSAEQAAMRGRTAALQGPMFPQVTGLTTNPLNLRPRWSTGLAPAGEAGRPFQPSVTGYNLKNTSLTNGGGSGGGGGGGWGGGYGKKKGGNGGGGNRGGGYSYDAKAYADRAPSWLMNLINWNFKG